jgi:O-antigen/teichoic acid export membrane protein
MGVSLYTSRVVLNTLGIEDYGIYNIVGGVIVMFGFLNSSMSGATSRFLTFELGRKDYERLKKTFSAALTIHLIIALLILVLGETAGLWWLENKLIIAPDRMNAARWVFHLSILASIIGITQVPYNSTIIAHERMNVYAYVEILHSGLKLGIVFLLVIGNFDKLILYAVLTLCVTLVITSIYKIYCARNFAESHYKFHWDKEIIKPMISFSGWNLYQTSSVTLKTQGINMILNMFFGVVLNAAYGIAVQVQNAVNTFSENFLTAVRPQIIKYYATGNFTKMQSLVINSSKFSFLLLFLVAFPLILENNFVLHLWLKKVPDYAGIFSQLFLIYVIIVSSTNSITTAIQATGRVKSFSFIGGTINLLVIPVTYFLFKAGYSPIVPMVVNIISIFIFTIIKILILKNKIPQFSLRKLCLNFVLIIGIIAVLSSLLPIWIHYSFEEGFLRFLLVSGSFVFILFLTSYHIALNRQMRAKAHLIIDGRLRIFRKNE